MLRRRRRRIIGGVLIVLGVVLMVLAPDSHGGIALLVAAIALEVVGHVMERRT